MTLYSSMNTSISGMHAQANRLGSVGDNIANASTAGYKRSQIAFSTLVMPQTKGNYHSGNVNTLARYTISQQGNVTYTTSKTDLAINGDGFFVVQGNDKREYLTRSGGFQPSTTKVNDVEITTLINSAGFTLTGQKVTDGIASGALVPIVLNSTSMVSSPTTRGRLSGNLDADATEIDPAGAAIPSDNQLNSQYTSKTTVIAINGLGGTQMLDVYYTKLPNNQWEVSVFDQSDASSTGFPYANPPLATGMIEFDPLTGRALSPLSLSVQIPAGAVMDLDLGGTTQLASPFVITNAQIDGSAASSVKSYDVSADGYVNAVYSNGATTAIYRLELGKVMSPDRLSVMDGNVFLPNEQSGAVQFGYPSVDAYGKIISGGVEDSNVDVANEMTEMIESQRVYTSNSKVFQTGADMWEVLTNMKR